ncbi:hypothetical protein AB0C98_09215 [Streptomyces sp. NPDC048558]|uniref:hypothetical protein n=1 Tax=Streptomyces sp. NPDC048558 TaxID=3155759 RepID=UPI00340A09EF
MSEFEQSSAQQEARRTTPGRPWTPQEQPRQDALGRYLMAVAAAASARSDEEFERAPGTRPCTPHVPEPPAGGPPVLRVRDVMQVPAACVPGDMPSRDVAHTLAREQSLVGRHLLDPRAVQVGVENGVVTMRGRLDKVLVPELLASVRDIDDVVGVVDDTEAV